MKKKVTASFFIAAALAAVVGLQASAADRYEASKSVINATAADKGYVDIKYTAGGSKRIKVIIEKDSGKYTYDLNNQNVAERYPLQMGDGSYKVRVLENTTGSKYATVQTANFDVKLESSFAPYLVNNQYVNYVPNSAVVKKASELCADQKTDLAKLDQIYSFVAGNIQYDTAKASSVQSGYLPVVDTILSSRKGICFDYSAVMAAMLRSQSIPTKLVTGYVAPNGAYHAWNEVYIKGVGWIKTGETYFDGTNWKLLDSTFLSGAKSSKQIENYIGNGSNYTKKYEY